MNRSTGRLVDGLHGLLKVVWRMGDADRYKRLR